MHLEEQKMVDLPAQHPQVDTFHLQRQVMVGEGHERHIDSVRHIRGDILDASEYGAYFGGRKYRAHGDAGDIKHPLRGVRQNNVTDAGDSPRFQQMPQQENEEAAVAASHVQDSKRSGEPGKRCGGPTGFPQPDQRRRR
jgi:hypothetical protein